MDGLSRVEGPGRTNTVLIRKIEFYSEPVPTTEPHKATAPATRF